MKKIFTHFLLGIVLLISCDKNDNTPPTTATHKLKTIISGNDTMALVCYLCPPVITQNAENFKYDYLDRLTARIVTTTTLSSDPIYIDTSEIFTYSYIDNSAKIISYSHKKYGSTIEHLLTYDSENRLIKDSITNPQVGNNKLSIFTYLPDTIIHNETQSFIAGIEMKSDTMIISGNSIFKEKIRGFITRYLIYSLSSYRNPLSYVNNFSLLASDYKNGSGSTLFMIYNPQYITYNLTTQTQVNASTPYTTFFTVTLDSLNRVKSFTNSSNGNKVTTFEYY